MFHIVEFLKTQEVEVVPALWVADEVCQWPAQYKADELVKAIRSQEKPGHSWDAFHVRILYTAALLHKLLTNQEIILEQLKVIQMNLQKTGQPAQGQDPLKGEVLPLKDATALLALEKRLREEEDLKNKMITTLSVIGGVDIKDSVWRIMKHCFANPLAKQLNWRGINGKTAFHGLHMKDVITGTVRNNRLTATATDQEVECYIKRWLHHVSDRDGGRREREERRRTLQKNCVQDHNDTAGPSQEEH
ncbi:uncharacterized protein LOC127157632 [Labeo rohita]|uniref:uncharacterized protein LOC127157632 n=1 Tax=Labeo rohita TaxID=84645 RepID=UPI0021E32174|nr:uncharacterized protein LOC127157632 [Labeo rohita]